MKIDKVFIAPNDHDFNDGVLMGWLINKGDKKISTARDHISSMEAESLVYCKGAISKTN